MRGVVLGREEDIEGIEHKWVEYLTFLGPLMKGLVPKMGIRPSDGGILTAFRVTPMQRICGSIPQPLLIDFHSVKIALI